MEEAGRKLVVIGTAWNTGDGTGAYNCSPDKSITQSVQLSIANLTVSHALTLVHAPASPRG
ncbi:hypothetical protein EYF80_040396 [Liparis tanakae]|uniref:Uncharacterized protein n=1 Tax=Liparis tanakae TaxID=230148 RepID=A0A4Z2G990_9TELE|nr:hypothetical protein EYF80_040396 [Liparis tanakae]